MLDAQGLQGLGDHLVAAAVEGGIDHLEAIRHLGDDFLVVDHAQNIVHEQLVGLCAHDLDDAGLHALLIGHGLDIVEDIHLCQALGHSVSVLGGKLRAVLPVDLVAIILLGVVAGGDVDAGLAVVLADGKAQFGSGAQGLENADMDAVGSADLSGGLGELVGVVAAVHADGDAPLLTLLAFGGDDVGKALSGPADDVDVHIVQTHAHGAAKSCGAKLQGAKEAVFDLLGIVLDGFQFCALSLREDGAVEPLFVFLHEIHLGVPPRCILKWGLFMILGSGVDLVAAVDLL